MLQPFRSLCDLRTLGFIPTASEWICLWSNLWKLGMYCLTDRKHFPSFPLVHEAFFMICLPSFLIICIVFRSLQCHSGFLNHGFCMFLRFILVVFWAIIAAMQHKVTKSYGEPKSPKAIKGYHTPYRLPVTNKKLDISVGQAVAKFVSFASLKPANLLFATSKSPIWWLEDTSIWRMPSLEVGKPYSQAWQRIPSDPNEMECINVRSLKHRRLNFELQKGWRNRVPRRPWK